MHGIPRHLTKKVTKVQSYIYSKGFLSSNIPIQFIIKIGLKHFYARKPGGLHEVVDLQHSLLLGENEVTVDDRHKNSLATYLLRSSVCCTAKLKSGYVFLSYVFSESFSTGSSM